MWQNKNNNLVQEFNFGTTDKAFEFIERVTSLARRDDHFPRVEWEATRVIISLFTVTDTGEEITDKDRHLADQIDSLLGLNKPSPKAEQQSQHEKVKLFADGGSRGNPGPSAGGYVILDLEENVVKSNGKFLGVTTNNQAEYHSLKGGLEMVKAMGITEVDVYMDSLLVINQMKGIFKIKNRELWPIHDAIKKLLPSFKKITFTHIPRELNKLADAEVNKALDEALA